ncbi:MAG: hypothetical protein V7637_2609 [Mycobacteriales bacterium]|jgi:hypothetical protein
MTDVQQAQRDPFRSDGARWAPTGSQPLLHQHSTEHLVDLPLVRA